MTDDAEARSRATRWISARRSAARARATRPLRARSRRVGAAGESRPVAGCPGSATCAEAVPPRADGGTMVEAGETHVDLLSATGCTRAVEELTSTRARRAPPGASRSSRLRSSRCTIRVVARIRPASGPFWLTLVNGGLVLRATFESSYPTIATSSGTWSPRPRRSASAAAARRSLFAKIASTS